MRQHLAQTRKKQMATEKKDPRFEADPKDFEVDLSQFESDIRLDTSLYEQKANNPEESTDISAPEPSKQNAATGVERRTAPIPAPERQRPRLHPDARPQTRASGRIDDADHLPETRPSVSSSLDEASPAARKTANEARKKKKRQSLIIATLFICGAAFFAGYLSLAEDRDAKAANAKFIFFFFAVVWLWFIISRGRKK